MIVICLNTDPAYNKWNKTNKMTYQTSIPCSLSTIQQCCSWTLITEVWIFWTHFLSFLPFSQSEKLVWMEMKCLLSMYEFLKNSLNFNQLSEFPLIIAVLGSPFTWFSTKLYIVFFSFGLITMNAILAFSTKAKFEWWNQLQTFLYTYSPQPWHWTYLPQQLGYLSQQVL